MQPSAKTASDRDEMLASLLGGLAEQRRSGSRPSVESVCAQHPELADELKELWAAAQIADELGKNCQDDVPTQVPLAKLNSPSNDSSNSFPRKFAGYELLGRLGSGGMGVVYMARQRDPDRCVAIKVMREDLISANDAARFRAEAASVARMEGLPNIVAIHEVSECNGQPYFSMQFVEGRTLGQLVDDQGPLPAREAARLVAVIARAVHRAHERGILHRDLKPSNVLVDNQGQPFVTDFGLAKRFQGDPSLTPSRAILGTPGYMAPEQADAGRGRLSPASDVYGLGAILYQLLTGRPPFQGATYLDTLQLLLEEDVTPPRLLNRKVPIELELICLRCLEKQPALRYASADDLARDLDAFLHGEPISARSINLRYFAARLFGETHHASVLENWGVLFMWHSLKILLFCILTNALAWFGVETHAPYLLLWTFGLSIWGIFFWNMRRRGGPVTFIERQMAHIWAAGVAGCILVFLVEWWLGLPVLSLTPCLAVVGGMVFLAMAGMLSGIFYFAAGFLFLTVPPMIWFPNIAPTLFGVASSACFFGLGLKYHLQRRRSVPPAK